MIVSLRPIARLGIAASLTLAASAASAQAELSDAFRCWFATDPKVTCVDPNGRDRRCSISETEHISVNQDPEDRAALVFITYLPDPTATGDAVRIAAAAFRRDGRGWRLVWTLPADSGEPAGKVVFKGGTVTYPVSVPKPGDPRCCPSGRRQVTVDLR